ncbi:hypothetical protein NQ317_006792 [Molorchus minor]|uniref:Uncharacterized protein n=1 Tax=Molorchus minor TaxID=1323400 RepID=A0ABQ9IXE4_9CUCU|nr:hypothetical protein NQ317_006792 [Molorchus minor]
MAQNVNPFYEQHSGVAKQNDDSKKTTNDSHAVTKKATQRTNDLNDDTGKEHFSISGGRKLI